MHYTIGELAKVVNLSTDAIRYYEEVGLLLPHHVDPVNRYRYYTPEQIGRITEIIEWKECGLTLEEIGDMLGGADLDKRQEIFQQRLADMLDKEARLARSILLLQKRIAALKGASTEMKMVLIIDDSEFVRQCIADVLERQGWTVAGSVPDGEQGLELYGRQQPDVVVLDIGLEGMDGIQVLKNIRQQDPNAKVVMCSGRGTPEVVQECLMSGAAEFVAKPFLPHVLADAVAAAVQSPAAG
ncbi:response regulator [Paenibacillus sp. YN15]|uniref:response regulator n=1 Tax=Paenibacillus sp. YN15 TaxID=1742774 RepID=UPI00215CF31C|nr:response regulator [Paenibacillus sp. YN15]